MARSKTTEPAETAAPEQPAMEFIGYLVDNPTLRQTKSGKSVTTIRVRTKTADGDQYRSVVAWNRTAEVVCEYLRRGRRIEVIGREQERTYQDADGVERTTHEVVAFRIRFLGREVAERQVDEEVEL